MSKKVIIEMNEGVVVKLDKRLTNIELEIMLSCLFDSCVHELKCCPLDLVEKLLLLHFNADYTKAEDVEKKEVEEKPKISTAKHDEIMEFLEEFFG